MSNNSDVGIDNFISLAMRTSATASSTGADQVQSRILGDQILRSSISDAFEELSRLGELVDCLKKAGIYGKFIQITAESRASRRVLEAHESCWTGLDHTGVRLLHGALGVVTESIEILNAVSEWIRGEKKDRINLIEECGDLAWYQAEILDALGSDLQPCLQKVIDKLRSRYAEKFTSEEALIRDLQRERAVLEG